MFYNHEIASDHHENIMEYTQITCIFKAKCGLCLDLFSNSTGDAAVLEQLMHLAKQLTCLPSLPHHSALYPLTGPLTSPRFGFRLEVPNNVSINTHTHVRLLRGLI